MGGTSTAELCIIDYTVSTGESTGYYSVAAMTFLTWDLIVSFAEEVNLVWQRPNGWSRWLYAFIRYVPLLAETGFFAYFAVQARSLPDFSGGQCNATVLTASVVLHSVIVGVEVVLLVRVHALYDRSRNMTFALVAAFATSLSASILGIYFALRRLSYDGQCLVSSAPRIMLLAWLSPVVFETFLFILTMMKFRESRLEGLSDKRPLLNTIVRDGSWGFVLALVVMVLNAVIYTMNSDSLTGKFYFWALSILSFVGSHVLLNLRATASDSRSSDPWDSSGETVTEIQFQVDSTNASNAGDPS
ncbi:hypothetical protein OH77DRAFT_1525406 [Trametes cingulata]|nr:hypothetical protein OH77DRAFT_1525406 [Trametes cingulata]